MFGVYVEGNTLVINGWDPEKLEHLNPGKSPEKIYLTFKSGLPTHIINQIMEEDVNHIQVKHWAGARSEHGIIKSIHTNKEGSVEIEYQIKGMAVHTRGEKLLETLKDPKMQEKLKELHDYTLTDIEHIRVRRAAQPDELAIEIASKSGKKMHLIVTGHFA